MSSSEKDCGFYALFGERLKSSMSNFHQLATSRGIKYEYKDVVVSNVQGTNFRSPIFEVDLILQDGETFRGFGSRKQEARRVAASMAYERLRHCPTKVKSDQQHLNTGSEIPENQQHDSTCANENTRNAVSILLEYAASNKSIRVEFEDMPYGYATKPGEQSFSSICRIAPFKIKAVGYGAKKKLAKRNAATIALEKLRDIIEEESVTTKKDNEPTDDISVTKSAFDEDHKCCSSQQSFMSGKWCAAIQADTAARNDYEMQSFLLNSISETILSAKQQKSLYSLANAENWSACESFLYDFAASLSSGVHLNVVTDYNDEADSFTSAVFLSFSDAKHGVADGGNRLLLSFAKDASDVNRARGIACKRAVLVILAHH